MSDPESTPKKRWGVFRLVLLAAFLLALATYFMEFFVSYLFRPLIITSSVTGQEDLYQAYNLLSSLVLFAFNPVICFLVFYKIGSTEDFSVDSGYFKLLKNSFIGGLLGFVIGYLGIVALDTVLYGTSPIFGATTLGWLVFFVQFAIGVVRGGIDLTFLAFAGAIVGKLRSGASKQPPPMTAESGLA
jgi:hypothetical protein